MLRFGHSWLVAIFAAALMSPVAQAWPSHGYEMQGPDGEPIPSEEREAEKTDPKKPETPIEKYFGSEEQKEKISKLSESTKEAIEKIAFQLELKEKSKDKSWKDEVPSDKELTEKEIKEALKFVEGEHEKDGENHDYRQMREILEDKLDELTKARQADEEKKQQAEETFNAWNALTKATTEKLTELSQTIEKKWDSMTEVERQTAKVGAQIALNSVLPGAGALLGGTATKPSSSSPTQSQSVASNNSESGTIKSGAASVGSHGGLESSQESSNPNATPSTPSGASRPSTSAAASESNNPSEETSSSSPSTPIASTKPGPTPAAGNSAASTPTESSTSTASPVAESKPITSPTPTATPQPTPQPIAQTNPQPTPEVKTQPPATQSTVSNGSASSQNPNGWTPQSMDQILKSSSTPHFPGGGTSSPGMILSAQGHDGSERSGTQGSQSGDWNSDLSKSNSDVFAGTNENSDSRSVDWKAPTDNNVVSLRGSQGRSNGTGNSNNPVFYNDPLKGSNDPTVAGLGSDKIAYGSGNVYSPSSVERLGPIASGTSGTSNSGNGNSGGRESVDSNSGVTFDSNGNRIDGPVTQSGTIQYAENDSASSIRPSRLPSDVSLAVERFQSVLDSSAWEETTTRNASSSRGLVGMNDESWISGLTNPEQLPEVAELSKGEETPRSELADSIRPYNFSEEREYDLLEAVRSMTPEQKRQAAIKLVSLQSSGSTKKGGDVTAMLNSKPLAKSN